MNAPPDKTPTHLRASSSQANLSATGAANRHAVPAMGAAAAAPTMQPQGAPDVGAMVRRVFAHWQVVIVTLLLGALITAQVVRTRKPQFKSETVIFYREGIGRSVTGPTESADTLRNLGTKLKETLLAQQTLRRIIDEFHLYPDLVARGGYAEAVDMMRKKTEFKSRSQDTFAISFEGTTREDAQRVCARMADILVAENAKRLSDEQRNAMEFLEVEKKRADEELERIEREISEFINAHPEFANPNTGLGTEVLAQKKKLAAEDERLAKPARGKGSPRRNAAAAAAAQPAPGIRTPGGAAAVDPVLLAARTAALTEVSNIRKELNEKASRYTDAHPAVRDLQSRLALAEANLKRAEEAIAAAQPAEPAPPPRKPVAIDDPYGGGDNAGAKPAPAITGGEPHTPPPKRQVFADPEDKIVNTEVEWARMNRTLALAKTRQGDIETKLYKAEMVASTNESGYGNKIAVLDPAYKPGGPSNAPNKTVVMIGLGASIAVGLVLSAAWGLFLDDRVFSASEIEVIVMVPVLATVPKEKDKKARKKGKDDKEKPKPAAAKGKPAATKALAEARAAPAARGTTSG